jgi:hypothetical protein
LVAVAFRTQVPSTALSTWPQLVSPGIGVPFNVQEHATVGVGAPAKTAGVVTVIVPPAVSVLSITGGVVTVGATADTTQEFDGTTMVPAVLVAVAVRTQVPSAALSTWPQLVSPGIGAPFNVHEQVTVGAGDPANTAGVVTEIVPPTVSVLSMTGGVVTVGATGAGGAVKQP